MHKINPFAPQQDFKKITMKQLRYVNYCDKILLETQLPTEGQEGDAVNMQELQEESELMDSFVKLYPLCKRILLRTAEQSIEITATQRLVLMTLAGRGTLTRTQLAQTIACSREQASRSVGPLVDQGYVQRIYDTKNRTRVWVSLTETGETFIQQEYASAAKRLHSLTAVLSEEERLRFGEAVETVGQTLARLYPDTDNS